MIPTSNSKTLDGIRMRKQNRNLNASKSPRYCVGVDTETHNGDIFLIADSDGNYLDSVINFAIGSIIFGVGAALLFGLFYFWGSKQGRW